jgi:glyoxylase-like metal-dependent hydrolase (beta-lactamase superfamily II)
MQRYRVTLAGLVAFAMPTMSSPLFAAAPDVAQAAVAPLEVVDGVWLVPGGVRANRQPDGNTVVIDTGRGLVVVDTGRHAWHRDAIVALAIDQRQDIVAIVNTHWHLDHVSGNPSLREAYPRLRVYGSNAMDGALEGFLAQSARDSAAYINDESIPAPMREDIAADAATVANGAALRPDVVIERSGPIKIGGRKFELHLVRNAVTAGDLWLYEPRARVAVLGDLVTLPAPFLDTACPQGWLEALQAIERTDFKTAIPGHGEPLSRSQLATYRSALNGFIDCAASTQPAATCASQWLAAIGPLLPEPAGEAARAHGLASHYVDLLRANDGRSAHCEADKSEAVR